MGIHQSLQNLLHNVRNTTVRICLDARCATSNRNFGIRQYAKELVRALAAIDDENEYIVLVNRGNTERLVEQENFTEHELSGSIDSKKNFAFGARRLRNIRADIYHSLYHVLPFGVRGRTVITLHDYTGLNNSDGTALSENSKRFSALRSRITMSSTLRRADHIIAASQYVANHTAAILGSHSNRITVSYTGIDHRFYSDSTDAPAHPHSVPKYLVVGYGDPPRNVSRVVAAMALLRERMPEAMLEIIGSEAGYETLRDIVTTLSLEDRVMVTRNLSDADLLGRMRSATALVHPSLNETYGAPIVEAQAAGCPVITSDRGPFPELAGNAAVLVDTSDTWALADAMERIFRDTAKRDRLVRDGRRRAADFTWEATAKHARGVYERLMQRSPRSIFTVIR